MRSGIKSILLILVIGIFFISFSSLPLFAQPVLRASWPFNNNSDDASGNGFNATLRGNAAYSTDAAKGSHSLLLNGVPDYVRVGPFDFGDEFTICAWAFLEVEKTNIQTIIGNAMGGSTVDGFKLFINNWETNNKRIIIESADGSTRLDAVSPENTFEEGFWNFVAVTMDRPNGIAQIYYNGEEVTESGAIVTGFQTTQPVTIGSMSGPDWYWTGMIDDVRIYQGLLSSDEINEVMNSPETSVRNFPDAAPVVESYNLYNYPNPFNPATNIVFELPHQTFVTLKVANVDGQNIRLLVNEEKSQGAHTVIWDGLDEFGVDVTSGLYFYRLASDNFSQTGKMLLVR